MMATAPGLVGWLVLSGAEEDLLQEETAVADQVVRMCV